MASSKADKIGPRFICFQALYGRDQLAVLVQPFTDEIDMETGADVSKNFDNELPLGQTL